VDVESRPEKFLLKCTTYPNGAVLQFVVRVYLASTQESVVECQRRRGDIIPFAALYQVLKRQADPKTRDSSVVSRPLEEELSGEHSQDTTQCLLLMAKSQFVDVKSKAVEALAQLSSQGRGVQDILIKQGSVSLLLDGCSSFSMSEDVHRPSLTALGNLSEGRADVCQAIADKSLQCLSENYTSPKDNCPQVVRECARVLSNIGQNLRHVSNMDLVTNAVHNFLCSSDPLTLQRAQEIEDSFALEGVTSC